MFTCFLHSYSSQSKFASILCKMFFFIQLLHVSVTAHLALHLNTCKKNDVQYVFPQTFTRHVCATLLILHCPEGSLWKRPDQLVEKCAALFWLAECSASFQWRKLFKLSINILNEVILMCSGMFYGTAEIWKWFSFFFFFLTMALCALWAKSRTVFLNHRASTLEMLTTFPLCLVRQTYPRSGSELLLPVAHIAYIK